MKRTIVLAASVSLAWFLCSPLSANAEGVPKRKAGLWELTTIGAGDDTTIIDVVCTTPQGKETISGAFTGDFSRRYRAQVNISARIAGRRKANRPEGSGFRAMARSLAKGLFA